MIKSAMKNKTTQQTIGKAPPVKVRVDAATKAIEESENAASEAEPEESDIEEESEGEAEDAASEGEGEGEGEEDASEAEDASEVEEEEEEGDAEVSEVEPEASDAEPEGEGEDEFSKGKSKTNVGKKTNTTKPKKTKINTLGGIEMLKTTKKTAPITIEDEDDHENDSDDDAYDDNELYLQKFDSELRENYILENHAESKSHNYEEVKAMTRVVRDGRGLIVDPLHKTTPILTKYEMTRILGQRAKQLDSGAKAFVKVPLNVIDGYFIAMIELEQKKIPFIIKRPIPNGGVEYWNVSDLEILI